MNSTRLSTTAVALALIVAACGSDDTANPSPQRAGATTPPESSAPSTVDSTPARTPDTSPSPDTSDATTDTTTTDTTTTTPSADLDLATLPDAYQTFIADSGGSKWVDVDGSKMHYVDVGDPTGDIILLGHGAPTNAFLWRDVMDNLATPGRRVIAFDLIGFGRSDHPDLNYSFETHSRYMAGFIEALGLEDVHLVLHDISAQAGFGYAAAHPDNVASITSFEALYRSFASFEEMGPLIGTLFQQLQTPGVGQELMIEQNLAVTGNLDLGTATDLDPAIKDVYGWFFTDPASRDVNLEFALSTPIAGEPVDAAAFVDEYSAWLAVSDVPKLVLRPDAGLVPAVQYETAATLPAVTVVDLVGAGHFAQEDGPDQVAAALNSFFQSLGV